MKTLNPRNSFPLIFPSSLDQCSSPAATSLAQQGPCNGLYHFFFITFKNQSTKIWKVSVVRGNMS